MKILWLCSWYPHASDKFDGDFIERQAKAIALHQQIEVIHIVQNTNLLQTEIKRTEKYESKNLRQTIVYVPYLKTPFEKLSKLIFNYRYTKALHTELAHYIQKNGLPDLVHVHVPVKAGVGALWLKRKYNVPFVVTEHANVYHTTDKENFSTNSPYFRSITKKTVAQASVLISVSKFLGDAINNIVCKREYTIIPNVVDTDVFYYVKSKPANDQFRFLHVSNLYPIKKPKKMIEAIALYLSNNNSAVFIFIGNKDNWLQKEAEKLQIATENIKFLGEIPYKEVAVEMQQANAFFLFSKSETFSCVTAEALCCGLPVIATNVGALPELVTSENGILVDPENIESLANAFSEVQKNIMQYDGEKISKQAAAKFNYEIIASKIIAVYKNVLAIS